MNIKFYIIKHQPSPVNKFIGVFLLVIIELNIIETLKKISTQGDIIKDNLKISLRVFSTMIEVFTSLV